MLERDGSNLGWTIARIPFHPHEVWTERMRLRVRGTINGFAFRTSLFSVAGKPGAHCVLVNKRMQAEAAVGLGGTASFTLEPRL